MKIDLRKGDVLELLRKQKDNTIDLIITSPPYNLGLNTRKDTNIANYDSIDDNKDYNDYEQWLIDILNECYRVLKPEGQLFWNHKERFKDGKYFTPVSSLLKSKLKMKQTIVWDRKSALSYNAGQFGDTHEFIYWLYKEKDIKTNTNHNILGKIWTINPDRSNWHPAPFPIAIPTHIIFSMFDNELGKTILDPFNGSGTTGVAAIELGHNYIGFDLSKDYLDKAEKRIKNVSNYDKENIANAIHNHKVKNAYIKKNETQIGFELF